MPPIERTCPSILLPNMMSPGCIFSVSEVHLAGCRDDVACGIKTMSGCRTPRLSFADKNTKVILHDTGGSNALPQPCLPLASARRLQYQHLLQQLPFCLTHPAVAVPKAETWVWRSVEPVLGTCPQGQRTV